MNLPRNARPLPWGLGFVAAILLILLLAISINVNFGLPFNLSFDWPPGQDYTLKAAFKDANGLAKGASVTVAGHEVGEVLGVSVQKNDAVVVMRITRHYAPLHAGTIARLRYSTLLAQKYVELTPAPSYKPEIANGGQIAVDETITPVDFDQFLSSFDPQTRARLQTIIQQAGGSLSGRQTDINDLLTNLHGLSMESRAGLSTFHNHDADLDNIILNLAITSDTLANNRAQLGDLIQQMAVVNGTIADQDQSLTVWIEHMSNVMADFDQTLNGNEGNLHTTIVTLDPTIGRLNGLVGTTFNYYDAYKNELTLAAQDLIPFIGSAISDKDPNGNYLRQYLACVQNQEKTWDPNCGSPSFTTPLTLPKPKSSTGGAVTLPNQGSCSLLDPTCLGGGSGGGGGIGGVTPPPSPLPLLPTPTPSPSASPTPGLLP